MIDNLPEEFTASAIQDGEETNSSLPTVVTANKPTHRHLRVVFSPCYPPNSTEFEIRHDGIEGIV
jgi:hypothetical protein